MRFRRPLPIDLWRREFGGYSYARFGRDLIVGLMVAVVVLPLALAFGVASGSTAAGLAGRIDHRRAQRCALSDSGPIGAMSAVLILVV